jgi:hypothetical protein
VTRRAHATARRSDLRDRGAPAAADVVNKLADNSVLGTVLAAGCAR